MKPSLRGVLFESHIAGVAIAVLLTQSGIWALELLWFPISEVIGAWPRYAATGFTDASYFFGFVRGIQLGQAAIPSLSGAIIRFAEAWILSQFVYGVGPFRALMAARARIPSKHA
jgi:hypothetical protein